MNPQEYQLELGFLPQSPPLEEECLAAEVLLRSEYMLNRPQPTESIIISRMIKSVTSYSHGVIVRYVKSHDFSCVVEETFTRKDFLGYKPVAAEWERWVGLCSGVPEEQVFEVTSFLIAYLKRNFAAHNIPHTESKLLEIANSYQNFIRDLLWHLLLSRSFMKCYLPGVQEMIFSDSYIMRIDLTHPVKRFRMKQILDQYCKYESIEHDSNQMCYFGNFVNTY